ncbi:MAG: hypothetical protein ACR2M4_13065 [Actinomycetota bacterium]
MNFETLPINARLLEPAEVAERFVSNDTVVGKVASQNHVIVLGPRGSGKTTMLAMMTQPAQRVWMRRFPESSPVSFLGILVRADLTWARQLRFLGRKLDDTDRRTLMLALYMNRSFMAMARYTKDLLQHALSDKQIPRSKYEAKIVEFIRAPCRLSREVETLTDVKFELNERNQRLWEAAYANRLNAIGPESGLRLDLFQAASSLSEALQDLDLSSRLALLLDELELVPREVRNYLREGLRDADSRVLLKLSLSPAENTVSDLVPETAGSENDDFTFVDLSYPRRTHGEKFTSALLVDLARRRGMRVTSSPQMLGRSRFEAGHSPPRGQSAYGEDSNLLDVFRSLAERDTSFAHYLARAHIRLDEMGDLSELERAQSVRKIRDIVIVREADLRRKREGRLRHVPERRPGQDPFRVYAGNSSVLALLEGNPR